MKKIVLSVLALMTISYVANAQQTSEEGTKKVDNSVLAKSDEKAKEGWTRGGVFGLNFGQAHFKNWNGGGLNSIALNSLVSLHANYKKGKSAWDNSLDLAYGLISQNNGPYLKSDDRIELNSKYGKQFKNYEKLYWGGLVNFRTQFAPGFEDESRTTLLSRSMSPGYLTAALGVDYKPNSALSIFVAPLSYRGTFVLDSNLNKLGAYGVDSNNSVRHELGGLFMLKFQKDILKNVNFKTQLTLFSNYLDRPQNIDVLWDVLISMKVNKYITASISTSLVYDHDIIFNEDNNNDGVIDASGPRLQFKEVLNVGFSYKF